MNSQTERFLANLTSRNLKDKTSKAESFGSFSRSELECQKSTLIESKRNNRNRSKSSTAYR
jgi:hypothetical protein